MKREERGAVTVFVVVFSLALLVVAGLVVDGGTLLIARRQAINEAEAAARAGAQGLLPEAVRSTDSAKLDPAVARALVTHYLSTTGHGGTVDVEGDTITVTVTFEQPLLILGVAGLGSLTVSGRGRSHAVRAVLVEGN